MLKDQPETPLRTSFEGFTCPQKLEVLIYQAKELLRPYFDPLSLERLLRSSNLSSSEEAIDDAC